MSDTDREFDLRVREIALREAVKRANGIDGSASTTELAATFEDYLRNGKRLERSR